MSNIRRFLSKIRIIQDRDNGTRYHFRQIGGRNQRCQIMADEVTSHNKEELALCTRFVDNSNDVREEFLTFLRLPRITGNVIGEKIITTLQNLGLEIAKIRTRI